MISSRYFCLENPNLSGASGSEARGGIAGGFSTAGSSVGTAPESGIQIGQKHQGADRPTEDPTSTSGRHDIGSASAGTDAMAREVDGGHVPGLHYRESNASHSSSSASASQDVHAQRTRSLIPPMDGEDEEAMKKRIAKAERRRESDADSKSKAAAVPVKSTGLAADGGDFDATKPGAGKEADRTCTSFSFSWLQINYRFSSRDGCFYPFCINANFNTSHA